MKLLTKDEQETILIEQACQTEIDYIFKYLSELLKRIPEQIWNLHVYSTGKKQYKIRISFNEKMYEMVTFSSTDQVLNAAEKPKQALRQLEERLKERITYAIANTK